MQLNELDKTLVNIEEHIKTIDEKSKYKIMFISEELLTNLVRHADFEDKTPDVTLTININKKNSFELEYKDNSKAFNLFEHKDPNIQLSIEQRELGGLGIYLVKEYAKTLEYIYRNGFNIIRITL